MPDSLHLACGNMLEVDPTPDLGPSTAGLCRLAADDPARQWCALPPAALQDLCARAASFMPHPEARVRLPRVKRMQNLLGRTPTVHAIPATPVVQVLQFVVLDSSTLGPGTYDYSQAQYRNNAFATKKSPLAPRESSAVVALCAFPDGTRVDVHLTDALHEIYVQLPEGPLGTAEGAPAVVRALRQALKRNAAYHAQLNGGEEPEAPQVRYLFERNKHFVGWEPADLKNSSESATYPYLRLAFDCPHVMSRATMLLRRGVFVTQPDSRVGQSRRMVFDVQESRIAAVQKIQDFLGIRPMTWVRLNRVALPSRFLAHSPVELALKCADLEGLPTMEGLAAVPTAAWDIETNASSIAFSSPFRRDDFVMMLTTSISAQGAPLDKAISLCHHNGPADPEEVARLTAENGDGRVLLDQGDGSADAVAGGCAWERQMLERWRDTMVLDVQAVQLVAWNNHDFDNPYIWFRSQPPATYQRADDDTGAESVHSLLGRMTLEGEPMDVEEADDPMDIEAATGIASRKAQKTAAAPPKPAPKKAAWRPAPSLGTLGGGVNVQAEAPESEEREGLHYARLEHAGVSRFPCLGPFIWYRAHMIERDKVTMLNSDPVRHYELDVPGLVGFDLMQYVMLPQNVPQRFREYGLARFCEELWPSEAAAHRKVDLPPSEVWRNYTLGPKARAQTIAYGVRDSMLPLRIAVHYMVYANVAEIARLTCTPLPHTVLQGSQVRVSNLIHWFCHRHSGPHHARIVINFDAMPKDATNSAGFQGAQVLPPRRGYYRQPVFVDDFTGLYPSIMRMLNLCYSTIVRNKVVLAQLLAGAKVIDGAPMEPPSGPQTRTTPSTYARSAHQALKDGPRAPDWAPLPSTTEQCTPGARPRQDPFPRREFESCSSVLCRHEESGVLFRIVFPDPPAEAGKAYCRDWQQVPGAPPGVKLPTTGRFHVFVQSEPGVLPMILEQLKAEREAVRAFMATLPKGDPRIEIYNARQLAIKVIMNSVYGLTGAGLTGRWALVAIAEVVTCTGREMIMFVRFCVHNDFHAYCKWLLIRRTLKPDQRVQDDVDPSTYEPQFCADFDEIVAAGPPRVIYGDTGTIPSPSPSLVNVANSFIADSNMCATNLPATEHGLSLAFILGYAVSTYITAAFPPMVVLDLEKAYRDYMLFRKKRYAGFKCLVKWPQGFAGAPKIIPDKADVCGVEIKRRDNFPHLRRVFKGALTAILDEHNTAKALDIIRAGIEDIIFDRIPLADYVISKSLKRDYSKATALPAQAVVRDKIKARQPGFEPHEGTRVPYVITRFPVGAMKNERAESPDALEGSTAMLDRDYYLEFTERVIMRYMPLVYSGLERPFALAASALDGLKSRSLIDSFSGDAEDQDLDFSTYSGAAEQAILPSVEQPSQPTLATSAGTISPSVEQSSQPSASSIAASVVASAALQTVVTAHMLTDRVARFAAALQVAFAAVQVQDALSLHHDVKAPLQRTFNPCSTQAQRPPPVTKPKAKVAAKPMAVRSLGAMFGRV